MKHTFLFVSLLLSTLLSQAAAETVTIKPLTGKIAIDGRLTEKVWQRKADVEKFYLFGPKPENFKPVSTQVYLTFDQNFIYVAARCEEPFMKDLALTGKKLDDPIWQDDALEFFFAPSPEKGSYVQVVFNADGVIFDLYQKEAGTNGQDRNWNSDARCKTYKGKDFWTLEAAIPLENMPLDAPYGDWKFHVARNRAGKREHYSFVQGIDSFHNLTRFFTLSGVRFPSLKLTVDHYDMGEAKYGTNRAQVLLKNWSKGAESVLVTSKDGKKTVSVPPQSTSTVTFDWIQPFDTSLCDQTVTVTSGKKLLRRITLKQELQELFINERSAVRFLGPGKAIRYEVPLNLTSLTEADSQIKWSVRNSENEIMVSGITTVNGGKALLRIFWSFMAPGNYKLDLVLLCKNKIAAKITRDLRLVNSPFQGI